MAETEITGQLDVTIDKISDSVFVTFDSKDIAEIKTAIENGFHELAEAIKETFGT